MQCLDHPMDYFTGPALQVRSNSQQPDRGKFSCCQAAHRLVQYTEMCSISSELPAHGRPTSAQSHHDGAGRQPAVCRNLCSQWRLRASKILARYSDILLLRATVICCSPRLQAPCAQLLDNGSDPVVCWRQECRG